MIQVCDHLINEVIFHKLVYFASGLLYHLLFRVKAHLVNGVVAFNGLLFNFFSQD
jgi:hypothetical protein